MLTPWLSRHSVPEWLGPSIFLTHLVYARYVTTTYSLTCYYFPRGYFPGDLFSVQGRAVFVLTFSSAVVMVDFSIGRNKLTHHAAAEGKLIVFTVGDL